MTMSDLILILVIGFIVFAPIGIAVTVTLAGWLPEWWRRVGLPALRRGDVCPSSAT